MYVRGTCVHRNCDPLKRPRRPLLYLHFESVSYPLNCKPFPPTPDAKILPRLWTASQAPGSYSAVERHVTRDRDAALGAAAAVRSELEQQRIEGAHLSAQVLALQHQLDARGRHTRANHNPGHDDATCIHGESKFGQGLIFGGSHRRRHWEGVVDPATAKEIGEEEGEGEGADEGADEWEGERGEEARRAAVLELHGHLREIARLHELYGEMVTGGAEGVEGAEAEGSEATAVKP